MRARGAGAFLEGFGAGAALMYLMDPDRGARRRSLARDKVEHSAHAIDHVVRKGMLDLVHRVRGLGAEIAALFEGRVDDRVLADRVRAEMGRWVRHVRSIEVASEGGRVTLSGPILAEEVDDVLRCVGRVRGVRAVENRLEVHETADGIPALQGEGRRGGPRPQLFQAQWAPSTRLTVGAAGAALALRGLRAGRLASIPLVGAGAALLARAITNVPAGQLFGATPPSIQIRKTIEVHAPVEEVFRFWRHFENFPRFMEHVRAVEKLDDKRSRWTFAGPAGAPVEWEAEIVKLDDNKQIEWIARSGERVAHCGVVRFEPTTAGTRIEFRLSWAPATGLLGGAVASLFRVDPKHVLDEDLIRLKSLIEQGKATAHGKTVTKEELATPEL